MGLVASQHVGASCTRHQTHVPCIAGRFLTTGPQGKSLFIAVWQGMNLLIWTAFFFLSIQQGLILELCGSHQKVSDRIAGNKEGLSSFFKCSSKVLLTKTLGGHHDPNRPSETGGCGEWGKDRGVALMDGRQSGTRVDGNKKEGRTRK